MPTVTFYCAICGTVISIASAGDWLIECPRCAHIVPVPAQVSVTPEFAEALGVLPEGVLALDVKFRCHACGRKLQADARLEGRMLECPACKRDTRVPVWSRALPAPGRLSAGEIEFLTGPTNVADGQFHPAPIHAPG